MTTMFMLAMIEPTTCHCHRHLHRRDRRDVCRDRSRQRERQATRRSTLGHDAEIVVAGTVEPRNGTRKKRSRRCLDKATAPLADTVTGTEAEMGKLRETLVNAGFRSEKAPVMFKGLQLIVTAIGFFMGGVYGLLPMDSAKD